MKEKLQLAVKSEFVKKLGILLASGSVAQLIPVALSFFISRNFTADSLAVYGLYFSIVSIVAVLATGKFEAALLVPKSLKEAGHLYVLGVISVVVVSTVTAVLSFFFDHEIAELLGNQGLVDIFWLIPVAIAIVGFYQLNSYMYIRFGKIKGLAMQKLSQRGAEGVSILITGYRSISNGLIFSDIIGRAGLLIISGLAVKPYFIHHTKITWQGLKSGFKNYKKYPISFAPSSVANALSMHLALFVISANYSEDLTGQFNFVRFVLSLPITFLGQSLSQVLLERFSAKARNRISIKADVLKLTGVLSLLALGFTLPILFFGENLFEYFFGQDWSVAGQFAQVMVCSLSLRFIVSPLSATFNAIDKIKPVATWQWGYFILTISLIPLGKIIEDASSFIFVYAVLDTLAYTVYWIMIYSSVNKFDQEIANEVL